MYAELPIKNGRSRFERQATNTRESADLEESESFIRCDEIYSLLCLSLRKSGALSCAPGASITGGAGLVSSSLGILSQLERRGRWQARQKKVQRSLTRKKKKDRVS